MQQYLRLSIAHFVLFLTGLSISCAARAAAPSERAVKLETLKLQFPAHVAGAMSEKTPPDVALLYFRYKKNVSEMNLDALSEEFEAMRAELLHDLSDIEYENMRHRLTSERDSGVNVAAMQNETWLKTKVRPWLMKLEALVVAP